MAIEIRQPTLAESGDLAYMILMWDAELPDHVRELNGDAGRAEQVVRFLMSDPRAIKRIAYDDGKPIGGFCLRCMERLYSPRPVGELIMWYVKPPYRGGRLLGLRLLQEATRLAHEQGFEWIEATMWADSANGQRTLERLGFEQHSTRHIKRVAA